MRLVRLALALLALSFAAPALAVPQGSAPPPTPTGPLSFTPRAIINILDPAYGAKCDGSTNDTNAINAAITAARNSTAYTSGYPVEVVGPRDGTHPGCKVTGSYGSGGVNATGFTQGGTGGGLLLANLTLLCSGTGAICLDTLSSLNVWTENLRIVGSATTPPMIGFQEGNKAPATYACCINTHNRPKVTGPFTFAAWFSAASESTTFYSEFVENDGGTSLGSIKALGSITGGSSYTTGTYTNVALTGSATGVNASATITVSGGAVTAVTLTGQGRQFAVGDTLTAAAASIGGTGSGFSIPVSSIMEYGMVMDGQNYWGVNSAFQTVTWTANYYYTFSENNLFGGSVRFYGSSGSPLWLGSILGLKLYHTYMSEQAVGPCVVLFDNNATSTVHINAAKLDMDCETSSANYDVFLTGSNNTPTLNDFDLRDTGTEASIALIGLDANITGVTAYNFKIDNVSMFGAIGAKPIFAPGTAQMWTITSGGIWLPSISEWVSPNFVGGVVDRVNAGGINVGISGPLDGTNNNSTLAGGYSCARRLSATYFGPVCTIQRASDSSSIDIYPSQSPTGAVDPSAVNAFCANTTCGFSKWYDQSGGGNNAVQATAADQPTPTIDTSVNGRLCGAHGSLGAKGLVVTANSNINGLFSSGGYVSAVVDKTAGAVSGQYIVNKGSGTNGWSLDLIVNGSGRAELTQYAATTNGNWQINTIASTAPTIVDLTYSNASLSNTPTVNYQGVAQTFYASTQPVGALTDTANLTIGNNTGLTGGFPGNVCEVLLYRGSLTSLQIDALRRNQAVFYGMTTVP